MAGWQTIFKEKGMAFPEPHEAMPKVSAFLKKNKVNRVLDLGSGSGRHVIFLAERGFDVYGTDNAAEGIKLCKIWLRKMHLNANLKVASFFDRFPFPNNYFDAIVSIWAIHHGLENQVKFCISEIERVLKPHGLIFIAVTSTFKGRPVDKKKKIEPHTWVIIKGLEKGVPHHIFNKAMVKSYFKHFKIISLRKDSYEHWCILARKKY